MRAVHLVRRHVEEERLRAVVVARDLLQGRSGSTVHSHEYGHLQYGSRGYKVKWAKYQRVGSCGAKELGSGSAVLPTSETGWKSWESPS